MSDIAWKDKEFVPDPIVNHMVHWGPWAKKFENELGDTGTLAKMLGYACEEIERLCKRGSATSKSQAALLFAYVATVDAIPAEFQSCVREPMDNGNPFKDIEMLNRWRKENRARIREWDV